MTSRADVVYNLWVAGGALVTFILVQWALYRWTEKHKAWDLGIKLTWGACISYLAALLFLFR